MNEELKTRIQKLEHDLKGNRKNFFVLFYKDFIMNRSTF